MFKQSLLKNAKRLADKVGLWKVFNYPKRNKEKSKREKNQMGPIENEEQNIDLNTIKSVIILSVKGLNTSNK